MFSFVDDLSAHAPFLFAWGPVALSALLGALIWAAVSSFLRRPASISPKDEDNYVFMDNADEHPMPSSSADEEETGHIPYSHTKYNESEMLERAVAFYNEMNSRRTVRDFSDRPVPIEVIKRIIHTAGRSNIQHRIYVSGICRHAMSGNLI